MRTIKRWMVVAALLMAGCGSRVAYAADAIQNMRIIGGSLVLENGSTVSFNGTLTVAPASTATWITIPGSTATWFVQVGTALYVVGQTSVSQVGSWTVVPGTGVWNVSGNGAFLMTPGTGTWSASMNGAPDFSTAAVALRGNVANSSLTVVSVAGSTGVATSVAVSPTVVTQILATNAGRFHGEILNLSTTDLYVPDATVTMPTGMRVGPGQTFNWDSTSPLYGLSATGTINVRTLDVTK